MYKLIVVSALLGLMAGSARADIILSTSNPPGTPLAMTAGTTSGPMLVSVASDNPPNDVMAAWTIKLEIIANGGATGALTFQDPVTGTSANPANYVFAGNGLGIAATNGGSTLTANDFFDPGAGSGASVPGTPGLNLLRMDFLASSNATGLFGIYAVEGTANTQWTDSNFTTHFYSNVPDGTSTVRIGDVLVNAGVGPPATPEPSTLVLLGLGATAFVGWRWRENRCRSKQ